MGIVTSDLLGVRVPSADFNHLPAAIRAAIRADMVRAAQRMALRALGQLRNPQEMMAPAVPLPGIRLAFLW